MIDKQRKQQDYLNMSHSLLANHLQTEISKSSHKPKLAQIGDFLLKHAIAWGWYYLINRFGAKHRYNQYPHGQTGIYDIDKKQREVLIGICADWATNTPESAHIAQQMGSHDPDYTIHLGDTYYVGAPHEIRANFLNKYAPWHKGKHGSFALLGNHEMYARGIAYYKYLLPHMGIASNGVSQGQHAAYFCLQNEHWRILGLDTGYHSTGKVPFLELIPWFEPDCRLDPLLIRWLKEVVHLDDPEDKRGLLILTHHQYLTAFNGQSEYIRPAEQLAELVGTDRKVLWLMGHEHKFAVYEKAKVQKGVTAYCRCIGHGGMPVETQAKDFTTDKNKNGYNKLVMVDHRPKTVTENAELGHNGYVMLRLTGEQLTLTYHDETQLLLEERWTAAAGAISGQLIHHHKDLNTQDYKNWNDIIKP